MYLKTPKPNLLGPEHMASTTLSYLCSENKNNNENYIAIGITELQSQESHQRSIICFAKGRPKPQNLTDLVFSITSYYWDIDRKPSWKCPQSGGPQFWPSLT